MVEKDKLTEFLNAIQWAQEPSNNVHLPEETRTLLNLIKIKVSKLEEKRKLTEIKFQNIPSSLTSKPLIYRVDGGRYERV